MQQNEMEALQLFSAPKSIKNLRTSTRTNKEHAGEIRKAKAIAFPPNYRIVKDERDFGAISRAIATEKEFAFDCETDSLYWPIGNLLCVSIWVDNTAYLVNFRHLLLPCVSYEQFAKNLGQYFQDDDYKKYGFNLPFDAHWIERCCGIKVGYLHFDGYIASWFHETDLMPGHRGLKALCERYLGDSGKSYEKLFGNTNWSYSDPQVGAYYACHDAELHFRLCKFFEQELEKYPPHKKLFSELDMPVLNLDFQIEREGFLLDSKYIREALTDRLGNQLIELKSTLYKLGLPKEVDPDSPQQLAEFLYGTLKLPRLLGDSTSRLALEQLSTRHPIIDVLLEYREAFKLKSGFVDSLSELLVDSRVFPNVRVTGTATGRSAMSQPNMQQMPAKVGPLIRQAFIAPPGYMFVSKDLKGQELRILGHYCGGPLAKVAVEGTIYEECAASFYGVDPSSLKKGDERRDNGKKAWLAMQYGAQARKVAGIFDCSKEKAQDFIDNLFNRRFPEIGLYQRSAIQFSKTNHYIFGILGRKRHLHYDRCEDKFARMALERYAINTPIQQSAAEQIKLGFLLCNRWLIENGYKTRAVLRIHDEIIFQVFLEEWCEDLNKKIDNLIVNAIPMKIEFETSTEEYKVKEDGYSRWGIK